MNINSTEISNWLTKKLWIIVLVIIVALSIWVVILRNTNFELKYDTKKYKDKIELLENINDSLKNDRLKKDKELLSSQIKYDKLYKKYILILNDNDYTDENPIDFISPDDDWSSIIWTIEPVASGQSDLSNRFFYLPEQQ